MFLCYRLVLVLSSDSSPAIRRCSCRLVLLLSFQRWPSASSFNNTRDGFSCCHLLLVLSSDVTLVFLRMAFGHLFFNNSGDGFLCCRLLLVRVLSSDAVLVILCCSCLFRGGCWLLAGGLLAGSWLTGGCWLAGCSCNLKYWELRLSQLIPNIPNIPHATFSTYSKYSKSP